MLAVFTACGVDAAHRVSAEVWRHNERGFVELACAVVCLTEFEAAAYSLRQQLNQILHVLQQSPAFVSGL